MATAMRQQTMPAATPAPCMTNMGRNVTRAMSINDTKIQANPESSSAVVRNSGSTTRSSNTAMLITPVDQPQMKMPRSTQWSEKRCREM